MGNTLENLRKRSEDLIARPVMQSGETAKRTSAMMNKPVEAELYSGTKGFRGTTGGLTPAEQQLINTETANKSWIGGLGGGGGKRENISR